MCARVGIVTCDWSIYRRSLPLHVVLMPVVALLLSWIAWEVELDLKRGKTNHLTGIQCALLAALIKIDVTPFFGCQGRVADTFETPSTQRCTLSRRPSILYGDRCQPNL